MLVLFRDVGERIIIDKRITVTVVGVTQQGQVKLGFTAPPHVAIHREEVQRDIDAGVPMKAKAKP